MAWRFYYEGRSTFSSEDGSPEDAPGWDVLAVAQDDGQVGHVVQQRDYYWWEHGEWNGGDLVSLLQWLVSRGLVKVGRYASNSRWDEITAAAHRDPILHRKSALRPDERTHA